MTREYFSVQTADKVLLNGLLLVPEDAQGVIQFNCGTATRKEYYLPFLEVLARNQLACCLWDYRGNGGSQAERLSAHEYRFHDYGTGDMPAIKDFLRLRFPGLPLVLIGHSSGGQQVGLVQGLEDYSGMIAIAVSSGYSPNFPLNYRLKARFFFEVFGPLSIALSGYVKSKPFGIMENLPRGVFQEWKDWCSEPDYLFSSRFLGNTIPRGSYHDMPFPIHVITASDDEICTEANLRNFWKHVKSEHGISFDSVTPAELGLKRIQHFGLFHRRMESLYWNRIVEVIRSFL